MDARGRDPARVGPENAVCPDSSTTRPVTVSQVRPPPAASEAPIAVLLVDDDELLRTAVARVLELRGLHVVIAESVRHALQLLGESSIDVVISDLAMPELTGLDLLASVREQRPLLPFVLMSGDRDLETVSRADALGASRVLEKPMRTAELVDILVAEGNRGRASMPASRTVPDPDGVIRRS